MYEGYLELGGVEIANVERVQKYVRNTQCGIPLTQFAEHDGLYLALGQGDYVSPVADNAPWYDANTPDSADFLGFYPLGMNNVSDSTRTAPVTESVRAGGTIGAGRAATREMRVTGFLVGRSRTAAEMGLAWLRAVAEQASCTTTSTAVSTPGDMRYFLDRPVQNSTLRVERHHYRTKIVAGPSVISERAFLGGGYTITVELIITAEIPASFTRPVAPGLSTEATIYQWSSTANGSVSSRIVNNTPADYNFVQNPGAEGGTASVATLANGSTTIANDTSFGSGARVYRLTCTSAARASFIMRAAERPGATAGQRWDFRALAKLDATVFGARKFRTEVAFRDSSSNLLSSSARDVSIVPDGVFHRWSGTRNASKSERYEGVDRRFNDIIDPLFTNTNAWYKNPSATYDFTIPGGVYIVATAAIAATGLITYPAAGVAVGEVGAKAASYKVTNTSTAAITIYGNVRFYGANVTIDGPNSADVTIAPGETVLLRLPAVVGTADTAQGYRAIIRNRSALPAGASLFVAEHIGETVASADALAGAFFSGDTVRPTTGVLHRWLGTSAASASERIEGGQTTTNRLSNPSFESGALTGWATEGGATLSLEASAPISGSFSGRLSNGGDVYSVVQGVKAGETLTFSVDYMTVGPTTGTPRLSLTVPGQSRTEVLPLVQTSPGRFAVTATATATGAATAAIFGPNGESVAIFDRARLGEGANYFDGSTTSTAVLATGQVLTPFALEASGVAPSASFADFKISRMEDGGPATAGDIFSIDNLILTTTSNAGQAPRYFDGSTAPTYRFGQPGGSAAAPPVDLIADQPDVLWNYNADPLGFGYSSTDPKPAAPLSTTSVSVTRATDTAANIEGFTRVNYLRMTATAAGATRNGLSLTPIPGAFIPGSLTMAAWVRSSKAVTINTRYSLTGGSDISLDTFSIPANTWTKIASAVDRVFNNATDSVTFYLQLLANMASGDTLDIALPRTSNVFDVNVPLVEGSLSNPSVYEYGYAVSRGNDNAYTYGSYRKPTRRYSSDALAGPLRSPLLDPTNRPTVVNLPTNDRWRRAYVTLDSQIVPKWADLIPIISVTSSATAIETSETSLSGMRIRFWPNPLRLSPAAATADQTKYESELVIARLPAKTKLVMDGISRRSTASIDGREELPANHLVFDSKGRPINWPELDCATPYVVTIDYPLGFNTTAPAYSVAGLEILTTRRER